MKKQILLGLDIGTSSLKYTAADAESGRIILNKRQDYPEKDLSSGILPVKIYEEAILSVLLNIAPVFNILSITVSTQLHSVCRNSEAGRIAYQWNCHWENSKAAHDITSEYINISGCPSDPVYPSFKLSSIDEAERKYFLPFGIKEHLIQFLTGELVTDYNTVSASGLFDLEKRKWNYDFVRRLGFEESGLPVVKRHDEIAGCLKKEFNKNQDEKINVFPGMGDGPSASYACSRISKICGNMGTSMAVRILTGKLPDETAHSIWKYSVDDSTYIIGGVSSNACSVITWAENSGFSNYPGLADTGETMFFPWLYGERTPYWSSDLEGILEGIKAGTDKKSINSAIIKGIGFTFCRIVEELEKYIDKDELLICAGGGFYNNALIKVISGAQGLKLGILNNFDYLASYGAVKSAADGLNIDLQNEIIVEKIYYPDGRYYPEYKKWRKRADLFYSSRFDF